LCKGTKKPDGCKTGLRAAPSRAGLAKVSGTPGKTRLINHFRINDAWYLVDLPGIGIWFCAKVRKSRMAAKPDCVRLRKTFRLIKGSLRPQRYEKAGWLQTWVACGSVKPSG